MGTSETGADTTAASTATPAADRRRDHISNIAVRVGCMIADNVSIADGARHMQEGGIPFEVAYRTLAQRVRRTVR